MLSEQERHQLRELVGGYLADRSGESAVRAAMETASGVDEQLWAGLGEGGLGVCGLAVPSEWGGEGHTFAEVAVVLGELGRSLACVPYFSSVVLAQSLLLACVEHDGEETAARRLPGLASGEVRGTVAVVESDGRWEPTSIRASATLGPDGWRINGRKDFVVDGHTADVVFVVARTVDGLGVFEVDMDEGGVSGATASAGGLLRVPMTTLDLTRRQASLRLSDTPARRVGTAGWEAVQRMLRTAAVGLAAESVGGMRQVLDMAVGYARTRSQFGRPIGSFQAVKHKCADMLVETESADSLARDAVRDSARFVAGDAVRDSARFVVRDSARDSAGDVARDAARAEPDRGEIDDHGVAASLAHAYCQQAYLDCASENIQVHGGIGFTWEHPAQLYYKRAQSSRLLLGDPIFHRGLAAELIGL